MNCFAGFAKAREFLEEGPMRPIFAVVSGSSKTETCYAQGVDIAICSDNAARRKLAGTMWEEVAKDVSSALLVQMPGKSAKPEPVISAADVAFPVYWESKGDDFSEMLPVNDKTIHSGFRGMRLWPRGVSCRGLNKVG